MLRHYSRRAIDGNGNIEIVDREFDFVRAILPYMLIRLSHTNPETH